MHECPICGFSCDCDGEDLEQSPPADCLCDHDGSGLDRDGNTLTNDDDYPVED